LAEAPCHRGASRGRRDVLGTCPMGARHTADLVARRLPQSERTPSQQREGPRHVTGGVVGASSRGRRHNDIVKGTLVHRGRREVLSRQVVLETPSRGTVPRGPCRGGLSQKPRHRVLARGFFLPQSCDRFWDFAMETSDLARGTLSRGRSRDLVKSLVPGTLTQRPCRSDVVTVMLARRRCHFALGHFPPRPCRRRRFGSPDCHREPCNTTLPQGTLSRGPLLLAPCHRDLVTGLGHGASCLGDLVAGFASQKPCHREPVPGTLPQSCRRRDGASRLVSRLVSTTFCHRDLVAGIPSQGSCDMDLCLGARVIGTLPRGPCHGVLATGFQGRCPTGFQGRCHGNRVTGS